MGRVLFISLLLLFLPFLTYGLWQRIMRGRADNSAIWSEAPVVWLMLGGVALAVTGLIGMVYSTGLAY